MSYASLSDLKEALRITDVNDDTLLQVALDATDTAIDGHCDRTFVATGVSGTRYFAPENGTVPIDDIYDATGLVVSVGGVEIPAAVENVSPGYILRPRNALALGEPYTEIEYASYPYTSFPLISAIRRAEVSVTTDKWGYAATVPVAVEQAALLQASRFWTRRLAPFGIAGSPELGSEIRLLAKLDPDVAVLLSRLVKYR